MCSVAKREEEDDEEEEQSLLGASVAAIELFNGTP